MTIAFTGVCGTCLHTASSATCTARIRRRSQRNALGKVTSKPRSASAARSIVPNSFAATAAESMEISKPGSLEAKKSGIRLNVR